MPFPSKEKYIRKLNGKKDIKVNRVYAFDFNVSY